MTFSTLGTMASYVPKVGVTGTVDLSTAVVKGAGMDLITPTSVAGSGVTLSDGQINIAAATTISVNGCFSAAYDTYQIVLYMTTGGTGSVAMRLRVSGADNSTANYNAQRMGVTGGTTAILARTASATSWFGFTPVTSLQGMRIDLYRPFLTSTTFGLVSMARGTDSNIDIDNYSLGHNTATSFDGFTIDPGSAATGTMRVYGLRKS